MQAKGDVCHGGRESRFGKNCRAWSRLAQTEQALGNMAESKLESTMASEGGDRWIARHLLLCDAAGTSGGIPVQ
eukprot:c47569_g1_i1 orf=1-219(-)